MQGEVEGRAATLRIFDSRRRASHMTPDQINGALEFGSALLMGLNVRRLTIDKSIAGVSLIPTLFFDTWGFWNLYYYPTLDQWWSFTGGAFLITINVTWNTTATNFVSGSA